MADVETYELKGGKPTIVKDPNATLDYTFNWSDWLDQVSDTIASVVWVVGSPLVKTSESFSALAATVWVSGGVVGTTIPITCRITTLGGRIDDRTIQLTIKER